jgi:preprotein translocase subunit YajC
MNHTISSIRTIGAAAALWLGTSIPAYAAEPSAAGGMVQLAPLLLIMVVFYFLLIRPQQKRLKAHKAMVQGMKKGDKVVTAGGIIGTVAEVSDDEIKVEIAEGTKVRVKRDTITGLAE